MDKRAYKSKFTLLTESLSNLEYFFVEWFFLYLLSRDQPTLRVLFASEHHVIAEYSFVFVDIS